MWNRGWGFGGGGAFAIANSLASGVKSSVALPPISPIANKPAASSTSSQTEVTVRKLFPESWLWSDVSTSG